MLKFQYRIYELKIGELQTGFSMREGERYEIQIHFTDACCRYAYDFGMRERSKNDDHTG